MVENLAELVKNIDLKEDKNIIEYFKLGYQSKILSNEYNCECIDCDACDCYACNSGCYISDC